MSELTMKDKLAIVNNGGEIDETKEYGSWFGVHIRKGNKLGKIIKDMNGMFRRLTVRFDDGTEETIVLNNIGSDPQEAHNYEWESKVQTGVHKGKSVWYRF